MHSMTTLLWAQPEKTVKGVDPESWSQGTRDLNLLDFPRQSQATVTVSPADLSSLLLVPRARTPTNIHYI